MQASVTIRVGMPMTYLTGFKTSNIYNNNWVGILNVHADTITKDGNKSGYFIYTGCGVSNSYIGQCMGI